MSDINSVVISGRLVEDPTLKNVGETKVCKMRIASSKIVGKQKVEKTVFIDVDAWNGLGEVCAKFLEKGRMVAVVGTLRQDTWESEGSKKSKIFIDASEVEFFGQKSDKGDGSTKTDPPKKAKVSKETSSKNNAASEDDNIEDDDMPF